LLQSDDECVDFILDNCERPLGSLSGRPCASEDIYLKAASRFITGKIRNGDHLGEMDAVTGEIDYSKADPNKDIRDRIK
jgi:hypothetical protein